MSCSLHNLKVMFRPIFHRMRLLNVKPDWNISLYNVIGKYFKFTRRINLGNKQSQHSVCRCQKSGTTETSWIFYSMIWFTFSFLDCLHNVQNCWSFLRSDFATVIFAGSIVLKLTTGNFSHPVVVCQFPQKIALSLSSDRQNIQIDVKKGAHWRELSLSLIHI